MPSLVLFTGDSVLCGIATSATELIMFGVLQGIGGGLILPVGHRLAEFFERLEKTNAGADSTG